MITIYKYDLALTDRQTLQLPAGAEILSVQEQEAWLYEHRSTPANQRTLQLWALVDTKAPVTPRHFTIAGTGNPLTNQVILRHIDTVVMARGSLVWHIFEVLPDGNP